MKTALEIIMLVGLFGGLTALSFWEARSRRNEDRRRTQLGHTRRGSDPHD